MDLTWSTADVAFRDEVRSFLDEHLTDELRAAGRLMTSVYADPPTQRRWQRIVADRGWGAPSWPREFGGADWAPSQHYIYARERVAAGAPGTPFGIKLCGPALIAFGSPEQQRRFLPPMLTAEHLWCQGYSEPESGSDLASLQMRAVRDGDELVCTGPKIWTTDAHEADWMFCLGRTTHDTKPQRGITFLLIDMTSPGITVAPIVSPAGEHIQNQVFFDDVRVPVDQVVGRIDDGWTVAKYLLEFERGGSAYAPEIQVRLDDIAAAAAVTRRPSGLVADDPAFAARLALARAKLGALELYELRAMSSAGSPGVGASIMKVIGTELSQFVTELALDVAGAYGLAYQPQLTRPGGEIVYAHASADDAVGPVSAALAPLRYLNDRAGTIYAGTNEIQRNILAKSVLGL